MDRPSRSFIQAVEIWIPETSGVLVLHSGSYGRHQALGEASSTLRFRPGEALVGRVAVAMQPLVLNHFGGEPARAALIAEADIGAAVGVPLCRGGELAAVMVLYCGSPRTRGGAIEVWERAGEELRLACGYYGAHDDFRRLSACLRFSGGVGLPGRVYREAQPVILSDLANSDDFMRAVAARSVGFTQGVGVPVFRGATVATVLTMLSGVGLPLARAFEVWRPDPADDRLHLVASAYAGLEAFAAASRGVSMARGEGLPGRVWATGLPWVIDELTPRDFVRAEAAARAELELGVGWPVLRGDRVESVVVLLN